MRIVTRRTAKGQKRYRAEVWDNAAQRTVVKTFPTEAAAKSWGTAKEVAIRSGTAVAGVPTTLTQAADGWLDRARSGVVTNASGLPYKPSVLYGYNTSLKKHVLPILGRVKLADIRIDQVQAMIERLSKSGQAPQSVRNHINPLRVIFADARRRRLMAHNPLDGIALPSGEVARDRIATPAEAVGLLAELTQDRALWATAFYTGLRRGELMALPWEHIDLVARTIRVDRSFDPTAKAFITPKTKAGTRTVPFPDLLLPFLTAEDRTEGLVFGGDGVTPFAASSVRKRAAAAWADRAITLHECRHTYASLMLAAGVDMTKVSKWLGHSSITITVDRYGHLVPGSAAEDMTRFQTYLERPANA